VLADEGFTADILDTTAEALNTIAPAGRLSSSTGPRISSSKLTISNIRVRSALVYIAVAAGLVVATAILRGHAISDWGLINPDEAGLIEEARAARLSPVPWSTWQIGTTGPYWTLFLAGLGVLGAPLTLAFAHLLSAVLLALTAFALFVAASRAIGRGPALVATVVWWYPIATTWLVGVPMEFSFLSTEYLPMLLVVASALVPREQLAARPWLFAVVGVLAGFAVGAKYQVAPLAVAFVAAQLIVLHPSVKRTVVPVLWWLAGAVLPVAAVVLVMVASPTTNWTLVEQTLRYVTNYATNGSSMQIGSLAGGRIESTLAALIGPGPIGPGYIGPGLYLLVLLAGLTWLGRHSETRSNVARVVLVAGGLTAVLAGGMGAGHYLLLLFAAAGLAVTMPVKPGARLSPRRVPRTLRARALAIVAAVALVFVFGFVIQRSRLVVPLSPRGAAAAFSPDSVNRDPALARACPPGSRAMVWGYAPELYVAQDWQSTSPYMDMVGLAVGGPADKEAGERVVRAGIDRADCIVDATLMKRPICPDVRPELPSWCLSAKFSLPRFYPQLVPLINRQFHTVPVTGGCDGCTLYVRNVSS
jgi:hypothetical protein